VTAAEAEQLAFADSFLRLRITLRNPAERSSLEQVPAPAAVRKGSPVQQQAATRLVVRTFGLTEESWSDLSKRLDRGVESETLSVAVPDTLDITGFLAQHHAVLHSEKTVDAQGMRFSFIDLPPTQGTEQRIRVGLALGSEPGRVRVRPEMRNNSGGRAETRSLDTEVRLGGSAVRRRIGCRRRSSCRDLSGR
jgi:hypothetical protein